MTNSEIKRERELFLPCRVFVLAPHKLHHHLESNLVPHHHHPDQVQLHALHPGGPIEQRTSKLQKTIFYKSSFTTRNYGGGEITSSTQNPFPPLLCIIFTIVTFRISSGNLAEGKLAAIFLRNGWGSGFEARVCLYNILKYLRQNLDSMPGIRILYREIFFKLHALEFSLCRVWFGQKLATRDSRRCRNLGGFERT